MSPVASDPPSLLLSASENPLLSESDKPFASIKPQGGLLLLQHDIAPLQLEGAKNTVANRQRLAVDLVTPESSRPPSPYGVKQMVDYDGLSWPSTCFLTPNSRRVAGANRLFRIGVGTRARLEATPEEEAARLNKLSRA